MWNFLHLIALFSIGWQGGIQNWKHENLHAWQRRSWNWKCLLVKSLLSQILKLRAECYLDGSKYHILTSFTNYWMENILQSHTLGPQTCYKIGLGWNFEVMSKVFLCKASNNFVSNLLTKPVQINPVVQLKFPKFLKGSRPS